MTHALQTPQAAATWLQELVTGSLQTDHRQVAAGDGFLAWPGARHDARRFAADALARGAGACLLEADGAQQASDARIAAYRGLKADASHIADLFFDRPSDALALLAVTGTNGKTSTAWWLAQALSSKRLAAPLPCAMVGTLGVGRPPEAGDTRGVDALAALAGTGLTTPDPVLLQASLRRFADAGLRACAIEASSIGIVDHRLDGLRIHTAIFTNFTQDHLDYHGTMDAYWLAKARLFQWPGLRAAVINIDDAKGAELDAALASAPLDLWTISCNAPARLRAEAIRYQHAGLAFDVVEGGERHTLVTGLIGDYNVSNLLGVLAAMRTVGVPLSGAVAACAGLTPVPGRMQCVAEPGMPVVAVDYAHTPDALEKALEALRPMGRARAGALWCVFGCGGDRDPGKRPLMGAVAARADHVVVTSDNPRSEDPQAIIDQIMPPLAGHRSVQRQVDRSAAIRDAVVGAGSADVILVAGKGHEDYQEIGGQRRPFSDLAQVQVALAERRGSRAAQGACA